MLVRSRRRFLGGSLATISLGLAAGCGIRPPWGSPARPRRIGYLSGGQGNPPGTIGTLERFRAGLHELGWVEGQNVTIEARWWGDTPDRAVELAADLVALPVDVIMAFGSHDAHVARQATATIPIVMMGLTDPVGQGLVASLARPGGNITGLSSGTVELTGKRLELLKEIVPGLRRVAVLWDPKNDPAQPPQWAAIQAASPALGLDLLPLAVTALDEIAPAFQAAADAQAGAALVVQNSVMRVNRAMLGTLTRRSRLPTMCPDRIFPETGSLVSYGANFPEMNRAAATVAHKILNGANPADLPVEQPTKVDFVLNRGTAQALGLTIPPSMLQQATELIQ